MNQAGDGAEDLPADLTAMIASSWARPCGQRRAKREADAIVRQLAAQGEADAPG